MRSNASNQRRNASCACPLTCRGERRPCGRRSGSRRKNANYCAATLLACLPRSRSITARQPVLRSALCLIMQAVIFGIFGISELHRRKASPVHICCASALKAKLALDDRAENETAKANTKLAWRIVLEKEAVIFGTLVSRSWRRVVDVH